VAVIVKEMGLRGARAKEGLNRKPVVAAGKLARQRTTEEKRIVD